MLLPNFITNKWIVLCAALSGFTLVAMLNFFIIKYTLWAILLGCPLSLVLRGRGYDKVTSILLLAVYTLVFMTGFLPARLIQPLPRLFEEPLPLSHRCSVSLIQIGSMPADPGQMIVNFTLSCRQHFQPEAMTLFLLIPLLAVVLMSSKTGHIVMQRIPNRYFEGVGLFSGQLAARLPSFVTRRLLTGCINAGVWGLALTLLHRPYAAECSLFMGLASLTPFWGLWMGCLPPFILFHEPYGTAGLIGLVIALAVLWLINHFIGPEEFECDFLRGNRFICPLLLIAGFTLLGITGLLSICPVYSLSFLFSRCLHHALPLLPCSTVSGAKI